MSKFRTIALSDLTGTGQSTAANVSDLDVLHITVGGTFVGTYTVEGSTDGTNFAAIVDINANSLTGLTAPTTAQLPAGLRSVRVNCTAYTSGTIESDVSGHNQQLR